MHQNTSIHQLLTDILLADSCPSLNTTTPEPNITRQKSYCYAHRYVARNRYPILSIALLLLFVVFSVHEHTILRNDRMS